MSRMLKTKKIVNINMKTILLNVISLFRSNLAKVICSICDAIKAFFQYKHDSIKNKKEEKEQKQKEEYEKKVDTVTKDGTIEDLLNLKR